MRDSVRTDTFPGESPGTPLLYSNKQKEDRDEVPEVTVFVVGLLKVEKRRKRDLYPFCRR